MIIQIVIIIVVLALLYLLLRHWPETDAPKRASWAPPRTLVTPKDESDSRLPWGRRLLGMLSQIWRFITHLFTDEKRPVKTQPGSDEFAEFIGVAETPPNRRLPWQRPPTRSDRVGREKRLAGPLSPVRASQTKADHVTPSESPLALNNWLSRWGRPAKPAEPSTTQSEVDVLLARAETAKRNNSFSEAEKLLVRAAAKEPTNARVYAKLGLLYLEQGENWTEAEESFQQALRLDPKNGFVHNNLGLVLFNQDRFTAAAKEFEAACRVDDAMASRHANLGLCYLSLRQYAKAEQEFKRANRLDSDNPEYPELAKEAAEKRASHRP